MTTYGFRCENCGEFDRSFAMAAVPAATACPTCRAASRRVWAAPHLGRTGLGMRLQDATRRTADEPRVVTRHA